MNKLAQVGYAVKKILLASCACWSGTLPLSGEPTGDGFNSPQRRVQTHKDFARYQTPTGTPAPPGQNIGSHSLESTLLAWAARWPIAPMKASMRHVLGKHSDRRDHSMLVYSRDSRPAAMHHLAAMVADIRSGVFDPDLSTSVILRGKCLEPVLVEQDSFEEPGAWRCIWERLPALKLLSLGDYLGVVGRRRAICPPGVTFCKRCFPKGL
eukprot:1597691-Amphidinium_carterae.7